MKTCCWEELSQFLGKLLTEATKHISEDDEESIFNKEVQIIREHFSNRILIIDEVHNIRGADASKKESRNTIKYITKVIQYSQNLKIILLTANPMFNISSEIVWMLNMLLLNDNKNNFVTYLLELLVTYIFVT